MKRLLLALMAVALLETLAFAAEEKAYTENQIVKISGDGLKITRPFIVKGAWEMQWAREESSFMPFQVQLHQAGQTFPALIANSMGTSGTAYQPKPGEFYLHVNTIGKWVIHIVELQAGK